MAELHSLFLLQPYSPQRKLADALATVETTEYRALQPAVGLETLHHRLHVACIQRCRIAHEQVGDRKPVLEGSSGQGMIHGAGRSSTRIGLPSRNASAFSTLC